MKKIFVKTLLILSVVAFVFSSCLGDSNAKYEGGGVVYIKKSDLGVNYGLNGFSQFSYITSPEIQNLTANKFYELSFSVNTKDGTDAEGNYNVNNVQLIKRHRQHIPEVNRLSMPPQEGDNEIYPVAMTIDLYDQYKESFNDKFVISYRCEIYEEDKMSDTQNYSDRVQLVAYYDEDNQNDNTTSGDIGTPLDKNKARINLKLVYSPGSENPKSEKVPYDSKVVLNLSELRSMFRPHVTPGKTGDQISEDMFGLIQFEYSTLVKEGGKDVEKKQTIGSLNDWRNAIRMIFVEE